ncbi:MAG TPA: molybdenum cofactor synthesis domain-containing protein, partial [Thermoplasmataceae archaeon]|nr:molybdenum cofactor synthesis domain-containing protein [Thermoplasmataceae archaeon]
MHEHRIPGLKPRFAVLVTSTTRSRETDTSGQPLMEFLKGKGYKVSAYDVITDDPDAIKAKARELLEKSDALVISGGTGISASDFTVQAIRGISSREIDGFSNIFSMLSFEEIGTSAIMSSASAFVVSNKPVFCLPGSPSGARMG